MLGVFAGIAGVLIVVFVVFVAVRALAIGVAMPMFLRQWAAELSANTKATFTAGTPESKMRTLTIVLWAIFAVGLVFAICLWISQQ